MQNVSLISTIYFELQNRFFTPDQQRKSQKIYRIIILKYHLLVYLFFNDDIYNTRVIFAQELKINILFIHAT